MLFWTCEQLAPLFCHFHRFSRNFPWSFSRRSQKPCLFFNFHFSVPSYLKIQPICFSLWWYKSTCFCRSNKIAIIFWFSLAFCQKCFVQLGHNQLIILCTHDLISISAIPYMEKASPLHRIIPTQGVRDRQYIKKKNENLPKKKKKRLMYNMRLLERPENT